MWFYYLRAIYIKHAVFSVIEVERSGRLEVVTVEDLVRT